MPFELLAVVKLDIIFLKGILAIHIKILAGKIPDPDITILRVYFKKRIPILRKFLILRRECDYMYKFLITRCQL